MKTTDSAFAPLPEVLLRVADKWASRGGLPRVSSLPIELSRPTPLTELNWIDIACWLRTSTTTTTAAEN